MPSLRYLAAVLACLVLCSVSLAGGAHDRGDRTVNERIAHAATVQLPGESFDIVQRLLGNRLRLLALLSLLQPAQPPIYGGGTNTITEGPGPLDKEGEGEGETESDPEEPDSGSSHGDKGVRRYVVID